MDDTKRFFEAGLCMGRILPVGLNLDPKEEFKFTTHARPGLSKSEPGMYLGVHISPINLSSGTHYIIDYDCSRRKNPSAITLLKLWSRNNEFSAQIYDAQFSADITYVLSSDSNSSFQPPEEFQLKKSGKFAYDFNKNLFLPRAA